MIKRAKKNVSNNQQGKRTTDKDVQPDIHKSSKEKYAPIKKTHGNDILDTIDTYGIKITEEFLSETGKQKLRERELSFTRDGRYKDGGLKYTTQKQKAIYDIFKQELESNEKTLKNFFRNTPLTKITPLDTLRIDGIIKHKEKLQGLINKQIKKELESCEKTLKNFGNTSLTKITPLDTLRIDGIIKHKEKLQGLINKQIKIDTRNEIKNNKKKQSMYQQRRLYGNRIQKHLADEQKGALVQQGNVAHKQNNGEITHGLNYEENKKEEINKLCANQIEYEKKGQTANEQKAKPQSNGKDKDNNKMETQKLRRANSAQNLGMKNTPEWMQNQIKTQSTQKLSNSVVGHMSTKRFPIENSLWIDAELKRINNSMAKTSKKTINEQTTNKQLANYM